MSRPVHSPACRTRRSDRPCDCEVSLVASVVKVRCVCGNKWEELGPRDYNLLDCSCAFPGDAEDEVPDDSVNPQSQSHTYNCDRL